MILNQLIDNAYNEFNNKNFIYEKVNNEYIAITYKNFIEKEKAFAKFLLSNFRHVNILLISKNSINNMIADVAIIQSNNICVNINFATQKDELEKIVDLYDIQLILYGNEQEDKLKDINIIKINIDMQIEYIYNQFKDSIIELPEIDDNKMVKIIFSSGTTSNPKGIMLSLTNMFAGLDELKNRTHINNTDIIYLFLPLYHTYSNLYNFYYTFSSGASIYLSSGTDNIMKELKEVNPTFFCGVPLIYLMILSKSDNLSEAFGNRIKYTFTGGSILNKEVKEIYLKHNIKLLEAYAMTETASSFTIQCPNNYNFDSVGEIFSNMDVKIIDKDKNGIGKIVAKGDCIFLGYYKNEEETKKAFTKDGYFITKDLGYIKNNFLYITGRDKNILITSNGENIYVDKIIEEIKKIENNIDIKLYIEDDKLCAKIYSNILKENDISKIIEQYNKNSLKHNQIQNFKISTNKTYKLT